MKSSSYYEGLEDLNLVTAAYCSEADAQRYAGLSDGELPENVFYDDKHEKRQYWFYITGGKTREQLKDDVAVKNALYIRTIKRCVVFFTVSAVISLILLLIFLFISFIRSV